MLSSIHFDLHYQPTGRPEKDRVKVGLWFSRTPVRREILSRAISSHWIVEGKEAREEIILVGGTPRVTELIPNIPPYAENWKIVGVEPIPEAVTLYAVSPHMHLRGKDFKYIVTFPDGRETTILSVPRYDFNWQLNYELETPLHIPAGSKVISIAHFDNSPRNRYNPAPEKWVFWGVQSWEEMNVGMMELTLDGQMTNPKSQDPNPNSIPTPKSQTDPNSQLPTPNSQLPTPNSLNSQLPKPQILKSPNLPFPEFRVRNF